MTEIETEGAFIWNDGGIVAENCMRGCDITNGVIWWFLLVLAGKVAKPGCDPRWLTMP